jgi:hypothetical protein
MNSAFEPSAGVDAAVKSSVADEMVFTLRDQYGCPIPGAPVYAEVSLFPTGKKYQYLKRSDADGVARVPICHGPGKGSGRLYANALVGNIVSQAEMVGV